MKKAKGIKLLLLLGLAAVAVLAVAPTGARAQDDDADGFLNSEEYPGPLTVPGVGDFSVLIDKPDVFVLIDPGNCGLSKIPDDPAHPWYEIITKTHADGGLNFTVWEIPASAIPNREITSNQKGATMTEDTCNEIGYPVGWCQQGTLNDEDDCIAYTVRVENEIKRVCGANRYGTNKCKDQYGDYGADLLDHYIKWVMVHELGHTMTLARCDREEYGGHHYPMGSGWIMDQAVSYEDKGGRVTFEIPDVFNPESQAAADLSVEKDSSVCEAIRKGKKK